MGPMEDRACARRPHHRDSIRAVCEVRWHAVQLALNETDPVIHLLPPSADGIAINTARLEIVHGIRLSIERFLPSTKPSSVRRCAKDKE
jgi:hypothetical protein